jgi:hypothetical protein|tara:strand:+ start:104 stop:274 length:171 start_codon:yes stop_codon:yes gene_type:complete
MLTGEFLYEPSFKLANSFGKGLELKEGIRTILLSSLKKGPKEYKGEVPANAVFEIK